MTVEREDPPASTTTPRFVVSRPKDIHTATPWHRYSHYIKTLPKVLRKLIADMQLQPTARLLDYGCADMPYRDFFGPAIEYIGADLPGNPDSSIELNPDTTVPTADASFDAVVSTQVLEHVGDPALYLSECYRVLKPGGRLLLSTHGVFIYHPDPVDYWRWTCAGLQRQVEAAGFEIARFEGSFGLVATGLQTAQDGIYYHLPRLIRPVFALVTQALIALADRLQSDESRRLNASVFVLIAVKP